MSKKDLLINHIAIEIEKLMNSTYFELAQSSEQFKKEFGSSQILKVLFSEKTGFKVVTAQDSIDKTKLQNL